MANPKDNMLPNRRCHVQFGFNNEYIYNFTGRSKLPKIDVRTKVADLKFYDELQHISDYKLTDGALLTDIRTDRYIWGILDEVYSSYFTTIASCDVSETFTGGADETDNQRYGTAAQKLISDTTLKTSVKGSMDLNLSSYSSTDYIDLYVYVENVDDTDVLTLKLKDNATKYATYDLLPHVVTGWNSVRFLRSAMTIDSGFSWTHVTELTISLDVSVNGRYIIYDEVRMVSAINYPQRIFDVGLQTIDFAWWSSNTALYEIKTACEAEGARFYADENGNLRFENRQFYNTDEQHKQSVYSFSFNNALDFKYDRLDENEIINDVSVNIVPRKMVSEKEIWRYAFIPSIAASETKTIWASFENPCPVTSTGIVTPVSTTDYTANTASDGSGTDKTAQIGIVITKFSKSAKIEVTNNDAGTVYLTLLKVRGTPVEEQDKVLVRLQDSTSISNFGTLPAGGYPIDNKYLTDEAYAETLAQQILDWYGSGSSRRIILKNRSVPQLQIGDMITITNNDTGVNYLMRITKIKNQFSNEGLNQTIYTRQVTNFELLSFFTIGTSSIEGTDVIST